MGASAAESPTRPDASLQADAPPPRGLRASDAERDEVVARLSEEFAAGRLSHDTFMHRMNAVLQARHQADLPALLADLPATPPRPGLAARLRAAGAPVRRVAVHLARASANLRRPGPARRPDGPAKPVASTPLEFPRGGDVFSIGRHGGCDLSIADMTVSRAHARLERTPEGWLLTDLSSTNGTRVNGWRVRGQVRVKAGDLVSFGDAVYSMVEADAAGGG